MSPLPFLLLAAAAAQPPLPAVEPVTRDHIVAALAIMQQDEAAPEPEEEAGVPAHVLAMIEDARANGSDAELAALVKYARRGWPDHGAELSRILTDRRAEVAAARRAELEAAGFLDNWTGRGEIGATRSEGNVENLGIFASLNLTRDGLEWRHVLRANADFQETNGVQTRERLLAAFEPSYKFDDRLSAYGLLQYERDPFAGFAARYSASGGLGYGLVRRPRLRIDLQGGPALRIVNLVAGGGSERTISGRAALDGRWTLAPGIVVTQANTFFLESRNSTLTSNTGIEARLIGSLSARLSYNLQYESDPPAGRVPTDRLSRVTLIYGF